MSDMKDMRNDEHRDCEACEPLLAAYVDGEACGADRARLEEHVQQCGCCRDWLGRERAAREALLARRAGLRVCASEHLKARCAEYAARNPSAPRPATLARVLSPVSILRWVPVSVAAALVIAVIAVFSLGLTEKVQALAVQTTADHVKCARFNMPEAPADPTIAAAQWQARFGWPLRLSGDVPNPGLELRAVRRCAVTDGRVAHLIYSWRGEPLSVYVLPERTLGDAAESVRRFGHQSVMWSQNDRTYIVVTPRARDLALDGIVAYVRASGF